MQTITLTRGHKKLGLLAGSWTGEETCHPSPWNPELSHAVGRSCCRVALGGFAVIGDYQQEKPGEPLFSGHAVYTYDPEKDSYGCYWFDCMGLPPAMFRGTFEGDVLTLKMHDEQSGHCRMVYDLREIDTGRYAFRMDLSPDGEEWKPCLEGTYRREE